MTEAKTPELPDWNAFSPTRMWRDWMVKNEAQWSDAVTQILKDERAGPLLNQQISEMQLMQRQFSEFAQSALAAANMPSRTDIEALDDRMGRLEDGLASLASAISQLTQALAAAPATSVSSIDKPSTAKRKPSRTRKPTQATPQKR